MSLNRHFSRRRSHENVINSEIIDGMHVTHLQLFPMWMVNCALTAKQYSFMGWVTLWFFAVSWVQKQFCMQWKYVQYCSAKVQPIHSCDKPSYIHPSSLILRLGTATWESTIWLTWVPPKQGVSSPLPGRGLCLCTSGSDTCARGQSTGGRGQSTGGTDMSTTDVHYLTRLAE